MQGLSRRYTVLRRTSDYLDGVPDKGCEGLVLNSRAKKRSWKSKMEMCGYLGTPAWRLPPKRVSFVIRWYHTPRSWVICARLFMLTRKIVHEQNLKNKAARTRRKPETSTILIYVVQRWHRLHLPQCNQCKFPASMAGFDNRVRSNIPHHVPPLTLPP